LRICLDLLIPRHLSGLSGMMRRPGHTAAAKLQRHGRRLRIAACYSDSGQPALASSLSDFLGAAMDWKTLLFTFGGRLNRGKYWLGVLIIVLLYIAAAIIFGIFYAIAGEMAGAIVGGAAALAAFIVAIWGSIAIGVKRLHDREKSGWWLLLFWVVPGILSGAGSVLGGIGMALSLVSLAISIWGFVEIGCLKGTTGPNKYGPDPLPAEAD
jgi:uncharacterized membrane protein YhaH (DUF805 family)